MRIKNKVYEFSWWYKLKVDVVEIKKRNWSQGAEEEQLEYQSLKITEKCRIYAEVPGYY